jgi:DNA anti-recombination protein RmuC
MKTFPKTKKKISTSRSPRTSQKVDRVTEAVEEIITAAKTIADDPNMEQEELDDQTREKLEKVKRKREQEIEEAVLNSTQKTREAFDKTLQEIMTGVEVKEGKK